MMEDLAEDFVRGGPWCIKTLGKKHREEVKLVLGCTSALQIRKCAQRGSDLAKHLSGEAYVKGLARKIGKRGKKRPSGAEQRKNRGLQYGDPGWSEAKWGTDPAEAEARAQRKFNKSRPNRAR